MNKLIVDKNKKLSYIGTSVLYRGEHNFEQLRVYVPKKIGNIKISEWITGITLFLVNGDSTYSVTLTMEESVCESGYRSQVISVEDDWCSNVGALSVYVQFEKDDAVGVTNSLDIMVEDSINGNDPVPINTNLNFDEFMLNTLENYETEATDIPPYVFQNKTAMKSIIMPNVTRIQSYAFEGCTNLAITSLPDEITAIYSGAFNGCTALALESFPSALTDIQAEAFQDCANITAEELPEGITYIRRQVFCGCTKLALTELPSALESLGSACFARCENLAITEIPEGVTVIPETCFRLCTGLTSLKMPSGLTEIEYGAFYGCTGLESIDMSEVESVPTLGGDVFYNTTCTFEFADQTQIDEYMADDAWSEFASRFVIKS